MTQKTKTLVLALGLGVFVAGCGHPSNISKEADHRIANPKMKLMLDSKSDSPVHAIVMPHDERAFPPGVWFFRRPRQKRVHCWIVAPRFHSGNARVVTKGPLVPAHPVIRKLRHSIAEDFQRRPAIRTCAPD